MLRLIHIPERPVQQLYSIRIIYTVTFKHINTIQSHHVSVSSDILIIRWQSDCHRQDLLTANAEAKINLWRSVLLLKPSTICLKPSNWRDRYDRFLQSTLHANYRASEGALHHQHSDRYIRSFDFTSSRNQSRSFLKCDPKSVTGCLRFQKCPSPQDSKYLRLHLCSF